MNTILLVLRRKRSKIKFVKTATFVFLLFLSVKGFALNITYYVNATIGNDANNGTSLATPWKSINKVNTINFSAGDKILFNSDGAWYNGNIFMDANDIGTPANPIIVDSYGTNPRAAIYAGSAGGFSSNVGSIRVQNLEFYGGRMYGSTNTKEGITFYRDGTNTYAPYVYIDNCKLEGFGKAGIFVYAYCETSSMTNGFSDITIKNTSIYDCGDTGIQIYAYGSGAGIYANSFNVFRNILIDNVRTSNNKGTATNTNNNTGSGIVVSSSTDVIIQNSIADKNGINNGHLGGGPVGIWFYEVNRGIIQNCESFGNYASKEADGNGFGIDGGCQNCVIQYCYSHDNEGSGYGVLNFANSYNDHTNNTVRYNISQNDGRKNGLGGIYLWAANNGGDRVNNCNIYNNTVYLDANNLVPINIAAGAYTVGQTILPTGVKVLNPSNGCMNNVKIYNNIFYLDDANASLPFVKAEDYSLASVNIPPSQVLLLNNLYYKASNHKFNWGTSYTSLTNWFNGTSQEKNGTTNYGITSNPNLMAQGTGGTLAGAITGSAPANVPLGIDLISLSAYRISAANDLALDLTGNTPFAIGLNIGTRDFYGNTLSNGAPYDLGANEFAGTLPVNLLSFNARKTTTGTSLNWKTLTETNNNEFIIEKSTDGKTYTTVTTLKAKGTGTSTIAQEYTFVDVNPALGENYYRLFQKDLDGTTKLKGVVSVNYANLTEINGQYISIYPNPVQKVLSINLPTALRHAIVLNVFNMMGKSVSQHKFDANQNISFDVDMLKTGAYFLRISDLKTGELLIIKKFIKQ